MSFLVQFFILKRILFQTYESIQTPSSFLLPYDKLRIWYLPKKTIWKYCYFMDKIELVKLTNGWDEWFVSITEKGMSHILELKMQLLKAISSIGLAFVSVLIGFLIGKL